MKKELKPHIRFKGFTDAWEQRKVNEIADRYDNLRVPVTSSQRVEGATPYYGANGIQDYVDGYTHDGEFVLVAEDGANDLKNYPVQYVNGRIWVNNHAHVLQSNQNNDTKFLKYLIGSKNIENLLVGGGRAKLNAEVLMKIDLTLPKKQEQIKISSLFDSLDSLFTLHQRKCEKLSNVKKALLEKMFPSEDEYTPKIRFKGFTDAWEQRKLGDIGKTFTGLSGKTADDFGHGEAKFLPYLNIFNNPIADISFLESIEIDKSQNQIQYGDVFFTTSSETPEEVGMSSVWLGKSANIYLNSFCFGFRPTIEFNHYYFGYLLRSDTFRKPITILAQGISRFNISKTKVMEIEISLPSKDEQSKIGELFNNLDHLITLHQRE
jgi:type I restriction enzyme S subunit